MSGMVTGNRSGHDVLIGQTPMAGVTANASEAGKLRLLGKPARTIILRTSPRALSLISAMNWLKNTAPEISNFRKPYLR